MILILILNIHLGSVCFDIKCFPSKIFSTKSFYIKNDFPEYIFWRLVRKKNERQQKMAGNFQQPPMAVRQWSNNLRTSNSKNCLQLKYIYFTKIKKAFFLVKPKMFSASLLFFVAPVGDIQRLY
jgi:hypothetical protein